jgi:hypothetical protein
VKAVLHVDDAVGETRRMLADEAGLAFRIEVERWSERGRRARLDEVWWGRARARTPGGQGWFVDLGLEVDGVIEATRARGIAEGAMIPVRIKAEAWADKGPLLGLADMSASAPRPDRAGRLTGPASDPLLAGVDVGGQSDGADARRAIDAAIEAALATEAAIPGGGRLTIETTRAMTVVDVDAAGRSDAAAGYALRLNLAAAGEIARQVSLRSVGGLLAVDFLTMANPGQGAQTAGAFKEALRARLGRASDVEGVSRLGVCLAAISRRGRPIRDALAAPADEREALDALRLIESEGEARRGRRIEAEISEAAATWLERSVIDWKPALAGRIGERWLFRTTHRPPGRPEIRSLT